MTTPPKELRDLLNNIKSKIPPERQKVFLDKIRDNYDGLGSNTVKGAVTGAALGALLEALPLGETLTGIDDCVEFGAAIGAWVGYAKDDKERKERERIFKIINDAVSEALK